MSGELGGVQMTPGLALEVQLAERVEKDWDVIEQLWVSPELKRWLAQNATKEAISEHSWLKSNLVFNDSLREQISLLNTVAAPPLEAIRCCDSAPDGPTLAILPKLFHDAKEKSIAAALSEADLTYNIQAIYSSHQEGCVSLWARAAAAVNPIASDEAS
eukprot:scaffold245037_cov43-Prasinocladus_malaysianus.AAC.1